MQKLKKNIAMLEKGNILEDKLHRRLKKERGRNLKAFKIVLGLSKFVTLIPS